MQGAAPKASVLSCGVYCDLEESGNVEHIIKKANKRLFFLRYCRLANLSTEVGITCYVTKIRPLLEHGALLKYGVPTWDGLPHNLENELETIQVRSFKILGRPHEFLP